MHNEEKRYALTDVHSHDRQYESQAIKPDMNNDLVRHGFSRDYTRDYTDPNLTLTIYQP